MEEATGEALVANAAIRGVIGWIMELIIMFSPNSKKAVKLVEEISEEIKAMNL